MLNVDQSWDGLTADLMGQAQGPTQASVEIADSPAKVEATLKSIPLYVELFEGAFPREGEAVTFENMAHAIETFEVPDYAPVRCLPPRRPGCHERRSEGGPCLVRGQGGPPASQESAPAVTASIPSA